MTCTVSMWLLVIFSGDTCRTPSCSEQDDLNLRTGMIGASTAVDDEEVLVILGSMKSTVSHVGDKKYFSS